MHDTRTSLSLASLLYKEQWAETGKGQQEGSTKTFWDESTIVQLCFAYEQQQVCRMAEACKLGKLSYKVKCLDKHTFLM